MALDKRSHVILTFGTYIKPLSPKVKLLSQKYYDFRLNSYRKMNISRFSDINASEIKFDLAIK